jgi:hypothetical protein
VYLFGGVAQDGKVNSNGKRRKEEEVEKDVKGNCDEEEDKQLE